jgi:hypothetical protein
MVIGGLGLTQNVGIGMTDPGYLLDVNGTVHAREIVIDTTGADYVFDPSYKIMPLSEVDRTIKQERHLPGIPSASEMKSKGVNIGDLQMKMLAKLEEVTLHEIALEKTIIAQSARIAELEERLANEGKEARAK